MSDMHTHDDDVQIDVNEYIADLSETHSETVNELSRKLAGRKTTIRMMERKLQEQAEAIDIMTAEIARLSQFDPERPADELAEVPDEPMPPKSRNGRKANANAENASA